MTIDGPWSLPRVTSRPSWLRTRLPDFVSLNQESKSESHSVVSLCLPPHGLWSIRLLCPWNFPGENTGVGCHFLLQGTFLIQEWNLGLLPVRQILHHLSHQGSPKPGKSWAKQDWGEGHCPPPAHPCIPAFQHRWSIIRDSYLTVTAASFTRLAPLEACCRSLQGTPELSSQAQSDLPSPLP